ncbi:hypothetical protein GGF31_003745 [Allomyces arbusculus]|nr:hypothetical protein GGF31_003745 [Allomyces arbusculus]
MAPAPAFDPAAPPVSASSSALPPPANRRPPATGSKDSLLLKPTAPERPASVAHARPPDPEPSPASPAPPRAPKHVATSPASWRLAASLAWREATRQRGHYCLGLAVVWLVVVVAALLVSTTGYAPLIFLSLAEAQVGQVDLVLYPSAAATVKRLNYTRLAETFPTALDPGGSASSSPPSSPYAFHSPRFNDLDVAVYSATRCDGFNTSAPAEATYPYTGMPLVTTSDPTLLARIQASRQQCSGRAECASTMCPIGGRFKLFLLDAQREALAGIGTNWPINRIEPGTVVLVQDVADALGVQVNDYVIVTSSLTNLIEYPYTLAQRSVSLPAVPSYAKQQLALPVRVAAVLPNFLGKGETSRRDVLFLDYATIASYAKDHLHPLHSPSFVAALGRVAHTIYHSVQHVVMNRQVPHYPQYLTSDLNEIARPIYTWANELLFRVGFTDVSVMIPILRQLDTTNQLASFVNLILSLILITLGGLSVFLVYCLLMVSVETKTFELGVLRMIGMNRTLLLLLIVMQALSYSIPALFLGLGVAQAVFGALKGKLEVFLNITMSPYLTPASIGACVGMAIVVPVLASIGPVRQALSLNLHDSMDRYRPAVKMTTITVERAKTSFDPLLAIIGLVLALVGFGIYYFLPLALLTDDLPLLFNIFLAILIGMIGGLVVVASNFLQLFETVFTRVLFTVLFFENRALPPLVETNLISHRRRNRKTSMLYALSLSFIVFLAVTAQVQISALQYDHRKNLGGDIVVFSDARVLTGLPAPIIVKDALEAYAMNNPAVLAFAWSTYSLDDVGVASQSLQSQIGNLGRTYTGSQNIYGVSPSFFDMIPAGFLQTRGYDPHVPPYSPSEQLYTHKGQHSAVTAAYYQDQLHLAHYDDPVVAILRSRNGARTKRDLFPVWPLFFATAAPGFTLTAFSRGSQDLLVSLPTFLNWTQGQYAGISDLPMRAFYLKVDPKLSTRAFRQVRREVAALLGYENILDIETLLQGSTQASDALGMIFNVVTALIMVITFFSLNTSMYVNITEQAKEIGILRSLGLGRLAVMRLYFYESLILIMAAFVLGMVVGTGMSWTMSAQRAILTQSPIDSRFPWPLATIVVASSVVSAFLATVGPVYQLVVRSKLVSILKG